MPCMIRDVTRIIREFDVDHDILNACAFDIAYRGCFSNFEAGCFQGSAECGARLFLHTLKIEADDEGEPEVLILLRCHRRVADGRGRRSLHEHQHRAAIIDFRLCREESAEGKTPPSLLNHAVKAFFKMEGDGDEDSSHLRVAPDGEAAHVCKRVRAEAETRRNAVD
eukprot:5884482-Pleurochrysis_carterae.AAC.1